MTDIRVGLIADFAHSLRYTDLPPEAVRHCKRSVIDTFGVALGAFDAEPSRIARALAERATVESGARVIGTSRRTLPELAAFANGVMARYFDGNDIFPGGGGHASDTIAAILAAADMAKADGEAVITAVVIAYEIYHALWMATDMREKGMDNVFYTAVGGAVGAAKLLGLDRALIAETISLAVTPNVAIDATRYGNLSMWKGVAGGNAARNGVFAALLAAEGMTGPEKIIDGKHGLENLVGAIELPPLGSGRAFKISDITLKYFLSEGHTLSPITAALELCREVAAEDIEAVAIRTYRYAWEVIGSGAEKWRPQTRETADHSMPWVVAATLIDQRFSDEIFSQERLRDPRIHRLADRIVITEDPALTKLAPAILPCRMEITTKGGERRLAAVDYPRGHPLNPMTDDEVSDKFRGVAERALPADRVDGALAELWRLDTATGLDAIFEAVRIP